MKKIFKPVMTIAAGSFLLSACTTLPPSGPDVMVLPGTGKTIDQFRYDDNACRQFAAEQTGGTPQDAAVDSSVRSAAVGTLIGAVAGAAIGGGHGAAVGAGTGLLLGSAAGAGTANQSAYGAQRRYDTGYVQCMYAKGHRVPVSGRMMTDGGNARSYAPPTGESYTPPASSTYAPPAPGNYGMPPPPPR